MKHVSIIIVSLTLIVSQFTLSIVKTFISSFARTITQYVGLVLLFSFTSSYGQKDQAHNPIIFADVPDMAMIRVGDTYYMSSTTMHMNPGVPIMKSKDLVNWELISYCYDTLANMDELNLTNGKSTYGRGSWASSFRYHNGLYYVTTFAQTTGKTYVFTTNDLEKG